MPWQVDFNHSRVGWAAQHYGISIIHGYFKAVDAKLYMEGDDPTKWSADVTIETTSVESNCEPRDNHLRTPDYFEVETYPTITFKSKRVERANGGFRMIGDMTMHGVTREVTLEGNVSEPISDNQGNPRRGLMASGTVKRAEFNLGPAVGAVAPDIKINIDAEIVNRAPAPATT